MKAAVRVRYSEKNNNESQESTYTTKKKQTWECKCIPVSASQFNNNFYDNRLLVKGV